MNAFDYKGSSQIAKQIMADHKTSVNASKAVQKARDMGVDPGMLYGISRKADASIAHYNEVRRKTKKPT